MQSSRGMVRYLGLATCTNSDLKDILISGRDLVMKLDIDVYESLCGMKRAVKTLDNREITISTRPGEVSQIPTKLSKMFF